ncbi:hypothetical protein Ocin01_19104 [Orchesella cincta]|uniref:BED-type domain-containing protein n=1 Tax=Orchesella cincta TaxID=48709 RepID=A0A1D2M3M8_ORCCI|nr:hypothetical protein Ocin01_19104 [Orchesella cincta]
MLGENEAEASQSSSEVATHKPGGVQTTVKLPGIIDNRRYSLLSTGKTTNGVTSISANCLLCKGGKTIHGDTKSSGNFIKHLRAVHPTQHDEYKKRKSQPPTDETQPSMKKLCSVLSVTSGKTKRADHLVMMYIVNDMRPLSTVSSPAFRCMIRGLCQSPDMQIMCRKTLQIQINTYYDEIVSALSLKLKSLDYLCLTADCWSSHARAFLGVTCHWIRTFPENQEC